jgi:hypothetical protein
MSMGRLCLSSPMRRLCLSLSFLMARLCLPSPMEVVSFHSQLLMQGVKR